MIRGIALAVLLLTNGWSPNPSSSLIKEQIREGIEFTILCDFENAKEIYGEFIQDYPEEPIGYFYMAAVLQSQMLDEEDFSQKNEFEDLLQKCILKSKILQTSRTEDPWLLFYEGNAYLYRSFLKSKLNMWWAAYRDAGRGVNRLEKALEIDSTFYDAYLGVGSYKYWKSSKIKFLHWLPFVADDRELGIKMVKKSIESGNYVSLIGRDQLAWILMDAGKLKEAKEYAMENYRLYPQSRFFQWTLVEILYQSSEWNEAYQYYDSLLREVRQIPGSNHYNEISCLLRMAEIDYEKGNLVKADSLIADLFDLKLEADVRARARSKLRQALKLRLRCSELLSQQNQNDSK